MDDKKIEDYEEMLKICGDFMYHQNEYIKKLESQLITSRESQSAVPSEEESVGQASSECYKRYGHCDGKFHEGWEECFRWFKKEILKRGIAR